MRPASFFLLVHRDNSAVTELKYRTAHGRLMQFLVDNLVGDCLLSSVRSNAAALRNESERDAIVAPTLAAGFGPIVEEVAVMAAATDAMIFGARQN